MEKTDPLCRTQTSWETHQACHCPNIAFRVCVCVCCYLSILYILQRNAPACLHVTLVHPLKEEEAAAESYFLLGISLSISRFSFLPLSLRNFFLLLSFFLALLLVHVYNPSVFSVIREHRTLILCVCDRM